MSSDTGFKIKESAFPAYIARKVLRSRNVAMVLGTTVYLSGVSAREFLENESWVRHELKHIEQFRRYGFFRFVLMYLIESIRKGYRNNRFEVEAREAERS